MNGECLSHLLTEAERNHFEEQGYLYVPNALSSEMVEYLTNAVDKLHSDALETGKAKPGHHWGWSNFLGTDDAFLELVDLPTTLPKVWGILGWNIYLYHAHMHVKPPAPPDAQEGGGWLEWHQDSGRVNIEMETHPRPRLSLKVAYFLTDVSEPGRGNFYIRPGSHFSDVPLPELEISRDPREKTVSGIPEDAMPVCVEPGTAVLFDRRLWHSRSPNTSQMTRKALFYGYGYRWIRQKDDMTVEHLYECCDPIRRQLLGAAVRNNGRYVPTDEDVPLRGWLIEQFGENAVYAQGPLSSYSKLCK
ncbi:phytanoyl-CoA dioxygenase family protein [Candidatus Poribacteria bacterium]|nr:phytanoyl-CoA dioxygenase family protein [Candidatus Poribacteria bacterium]